VRTVGTSTVGGSHELPGCHADDGDGWAEVGAGLRRQGSINETVSAQAPQYLAHGGGCPLHAVHALLTTLFVGSLVVRDQTWMLFAIA
jgi:hypothetical protein